MKHIIILGSAFFMTCLLAFFLFFSDGRLGLPELPAIQTKLQFRNPVSLGMDAARNIYFIDNKYYRIVKLNAGGDVVYEIKVNPEKKKTHFEYFSEIGVDEEGNLYAARVSYFLENELVDREDIIKYNSRGKKEQVLYTLKHSGDENIYDTRVLTLQVAGDYLYFDVREEAAVQFWRVNTKGGNPEQLFSLPAGKGDIYNLCGTVPGKLYVCSYSGEKVFRLDENLKLTEIPLGNTAPGTPGVVLVDKIILDAEEGFYLTDLFNQCIYRVNGQNRVSRYFTKKNLLDLDYPSERILFKDLWMNRDKYMALVEQVLGRIIIITPGGTVEKVISYGNYSWLAIIRNFFTWGELILCIGLVLFILIYVYIAVFKKRLALFLKLILTFIPAAIGMVYFISTLTFERLYARYIDEVYNRLAALAYAGEKLVDKDAVAGLTLPGQYLSSGYNRVLASLQTLLNNGKDEWNMRVYVNILKLYNAMFYIVADDTAAYGVLYPFIYAPEAYYKAYNNASSEKTEYTDADGTFLEAVVPVKDAGGAVIAILVAGYSRDDFQKLHDIFLGELAVSIVITTCVFLAATSLVALFILFTIRKLHNAVTQVAKGNFDVQVNVNTKDEIGGLGKGFNAMSKYIQDYIQEITELYIAYAKFVPKEILRFLKKESIAELELGNQIQMDMTILFSDIRTFTTLSGQMTPQENFNFINSYLSRICPITRENGGFIDKYIGDAIVALFPGKSTDAIKAAKAMQKELMVYNAQRAEWGFAPIKIGIGIHTGKVILGILGEHEWMEGTVISDAVNIASRLEELTKYYGDNIIISEEIAKDITDREEMPYRLLDKVVVKGKTGSLFIYGFFGTDEGELFRNKKVNLDNFEKAVTLFHDGNIDQAYKIFVQLYKAYKNDKAVTQYIFRCQKKNRVVKK